jgi:SAM-dependent methyltransferase
MGTMGFTSAEWHRKLFSKSVLKQAKWREIASMLPDVTGRHGLDLGADNGIVSYMLRERGGAWCSADIDPLAVESIRELVGTGVHRIDGTSLPFEEARFDVVVVVDMLEHVADDAALVGEIGRVLRPGGTLIANVPHHKRMAALRPARKALGLTDEWHGHVRPGYTVDQLRELLRGGFEIVAHRTYNRFFSEALDIALNYSYSRQRGAKREGGRKGTVVTGADLEKHERTFRLYSGLYPLMRLFTGLDALARPFSGYSLIVSARRKSDPRPR